MIQQAAIKKIPAVPETDLLPKQAWMQELANNASLKTGAGLDSVMTSIKPSAEGAKDRLGKLAGETK